MATGRSPAGQTEELAHRLTTILGDRAVIRDADELILLSSDVYSAGITAVLAIRPADRARLGDALREITSSGYAVVPRGGGMSYTGGYTPVRPDTVIVDLARLDRIIDINAGDMTITVEAGVTWQQIYEALRPMGLRLPFFGTFSGSRATVGGGMSNGALFMGTARYGTAAEIVLGLEVITADGQLVRTGQAAFDNGKPFYRSYGPDLTGLFVHDAGALGIKTAITMRLMKPPTRSDCASFVFDNMESAAQALSDIARAGIAEEAYIFDPQATSSSLDGSDLSRDLQRLMNVVKSRGIVEGIRLVGAGRSFIDKEVYSLHVVCSGNRDESVALDIGVVEQIVEGHAGGEIANSIPKAVRANPFEPLNGILGADGERWAALNCKVAHSDAATVIAGTDAIFDEYRERMEATGVFYSRLCIAISNHAFSFEPVLRWYDEWLPLHRHVPEPGYLRKLKEPAANLEARALVEEIRTEIVTLFAASGAASNQIGKTYPYFASLNAETAALLLELKKTLDPKGLMNPGALGLPA